MKIANDVRWLASARARGLGEITHPGERAGQLDHAGQGEPDAVRGADDVCCQVIGNDVAVNIGGASGQLRAQRLQAADHPQLPAERAAAGRRHASFDEHCARGIEPNRERIAEL
jgi:fumarate hydratase class II